MGTMTYGRLFSGQREYLIFTKPVVKINVEQLKDSNEDNDGRK